MAKETYKYFIPERGNLRPEYGGDTILAHDDHAEVDANTLTQRHICKKLGYPSKGTQYLFPYGDDGKNDWCRISDSLYPAIFSYLTDNELSTVVDSDPGGFVISSKRPIFQPCPYKKTVFCIGDELSIGVGSDEEFTKAPLKEAIELLSNETFKENTLEPKKRCWESKSWAICNLAIRGASWANTVMGDDVPVSADKYPLRFDLAFNQRIRTLAFGDCVVYAFFWLGVNDLAFDASLTPLQAWERAKIQIGRFQNEFSKTPIILGTAIRRTESIELNNRLNNYNNFIRENYLSLGVQKLADFEYAHPIFSTETNEHSTGNTNNLEYYSAGGVYLSAFGYHHIATVLKNSLPI